MLGKERGEETAWNYTPLQLRAYMALRQKRRRRENAELLQIFRLAANGDIKDIRKILRDWSR